MFIVISYDITDNRRRTQVAKTLKGFGYRVQYSVFEAILTPTQYQEMKKAVSTIINPAEDSVRFYTLCHTCSQQIQVTPNDTVTSNPQTLIV